MRPLSSLSLKTFPILLSIAACLAPVHCLASTHQPVFLLADDPIITAADLSIPIYPRCKQVPNKALRVKNARGFAARAVYFTKDPGSIIIAFYRAHLPGRLAIMPGPITT